jgi:thiol-disulfide isomerase/thioredoxin
MDAPANLTVVDSAEHFQSLLSQDLERVSLINFWAPWAEPCKQMNQVVIELARKYQNVLVLQVCNCSISFQTRSIRLGKQVEAETLAEITESFEIEAVPSFILLRVRFILGTPGRHRTHSRDSMQGHTLLARIAGADAAALTSALATHAHSAPRAQSHTDRDPDAAPIDVVMEEEETPEQLDERMRELMNQSKVVLFMKGNPDAPRCGYSRQTVAILREQDVEFNHFDILSDESVRQGASKTSHYINLEGSLMYAHI